MKNTVVNGINDDGKVTNNINDFNNGYDDGDDKNNDNHDNNYDNYDTTISDLNINNNYVDNNDQNNDNSDSDDTLSDLNMNTIFHSTNTHSRDYNEIINYVKEEEDKLINDLRRNQLLIPDNNKKGRCDLKVDNKSYRYFIEKTPLQGNFHYYVSQRRDSKQSIEYVIINCCQFINYAKTTYDTYRNNEYNDTVKLLNNISTNLPKLCHQYFDFLYNSNLLPATIISRIDAVILLYEWMRLNSNNIQIYNDVSFISFIIYSFIHIINIII